MIVLVIIGGNVENSTVVQPVKKYSIKKLLVVFLFVVMIITISIESYLLLKNNKTTSSTKTVTYTNIEEYIPATIGQTRTVILRQGLGKPVEPADGLFLDLMYRIADAKDGSVVDATHTTAGTSLRIYMADLPKIIQNSILGQRVDSNIRILVKQSDVESLKPLVATGKTFSDGMILDIRILSALLK